MQGQNYRFTPDFDILKGIVNGYSVDREEEFTDDYEYALLFTRYA